MVIDWWLKATQITKTILTFLFIYSIRVSNQIELLAKSELEYEGKQNEWGILGFLC
jgi:hypothetical protein